MTPQRCPICGLHWYLPTPDARAGCTTCRFHLTLLTEYHYPLALWPTADLWIVQRNLLGGPIWRPAVYTHWIYAGHLRPTPAVLWMLGFNSMAHTRQYGAWPGVLPWVEVS